MQKYSRMSLLLRYFLHGISFSGIFIVLAIAWAFIFAALIVLGAYIGLIIGFLVLFLLIGGLNTFLTWLIWNISMKSNLKSLFAHGFVLFFALLVVGIPFVVINFLTSDLVITIVLFIIYCFIDGFVAKSISSRWEA